MRILVSGAGIAGPVLAYWLTRHGFAVTVVERAPALRRTGGHAVDLFRPAVDISERMGVQSRIEERATGTRSMTIRQEGARRPVRVDLTKIFGAASDRHVEIMRDDLGAIYYEAGRDQVEYLFGDSVTELSPDGEVRFENAAPCRFDLVVGADLGVRGLAQGARLISALPAGPGRALLRLTTKSARFHNSMTVEDYAPAPAVPGERAGRGR